MAAKSLLLLLNHILTVFAAPTPSIQGPVSKDGSSSPFETFVSIEYCPIGQPLKGATSDSFLVCGQCKPYADCPPTHFCKLDSPSKPGYCCLRKSGSAEGIVRQNSPIPSAVIELTKKANESINAVVLASEPKGAIQSTNEPTDDAEDEDYPESPQTTVGVADDSPAPTIVRSTRKTAFRVKSKTTPEPENSAIKNVDDTDLTDLVTTAPLQSKSDVLTLEPTEADDSGTTEAVSALALLYKTTPEHHVLSGDVSDSALAVNWPSRSAHSNVGIPSKVIIQEKFARRGTQRPPQLDRPLNFSSMFSIEFENQLLTRSDAAAVRVPSSPEDYWSEGGRLSPTSGRFRRCSSHSDCFQLREPPEWCRLSPSNTFQWTDRSCFCALNATIPACVIQRKNEGVLEWTFCSSYRDHACLP